MSSSKGMDKCEKSKQKVSDRTLENTSIQEIRQRRETYKENGKKKPKKKKKMKANQEPESKAGYSTELL
jgi:hypothetical protein